MKTKIIALALAFGLFGASYSVTENISDDAPITGHMFCLKC